MNEPAAASSHEHDLLPPPEFTTEPSVSVPQHNLLKLALGMGRDPHYSLASWQWLRDYLPALVNVRRKILDAINSGLVLDRLVEELNRKSDDDADPVYSEADRETILHLFPSLLQAVPKLKEVTVDVEAGSVLRPYVDDNMFMVAPEGAPEKRRSVGALEACQRDGSPARGALDGLRERIVQPAPAENDLRDRWTFGPHVKTFVVFGKNGLMDAALKAAIGFHNEVGRSDWQLCRVGFFIMWRGRGGLFLLIACCMNKSLIFLEGIS